MDTCTGSVGAGKTSAIQALSEIPPVRTEAPMSVAHANVNKTTTTTALDYGELGLENGRKLLLFGTPGQRRYDFMCRILMNGAVGVMILVDHSSPEALGDLHYFTELFQPIVDEMGAVVGVTHADGCSDLVLQNYQDALTQKGLMLPVLRVDARRREDVVLLVRVLLASLEYR